MKKRTILFVPILFVIALFTINISSCKDNPVITQQVEGFDSARFDIHIDTLQIISALRMYVADSSNIYLSDEFTFAYYNGITYNALNYGNNFYATSLNGIGKNEVLIGGEDYNSPNPRPRLWKWIGSGFIEIPVIDSTNESYPIENLFIKSPNEIWMMAGSKSILKYDGSIFKRYDFDTIQNRSYFLVDENNNLCCVRYRDSSNIYNNGGKIFMKFYKFIYNNWIYYSYHEYDISLKQPIFPTNIGNEIVASSDDGLYKYDGYNYNKILNVNSFKMGFIFGDHRRTNLNNILVMGKKGNLNEQSSVFHWNGKKWSIENEGLPICMYQMSYVADKIIVFGSGLGPTLIYFFSKKLKL